MDRLKSYYNEYFSDATKPSARTLFLIVVFILTLDIFRSVRFAHRHVLSKISDTLLNAYLYVLKTDRLDHEVSILLPFPVLADDSIRYLSVPLGYWLWNKKQTKLEITAEMVRHALDNIDPDRQVFLLCESWYLKGCVADL